MRKIKKFLMLLLLLAGALLGFWVLIDNPQTITFRLIGFEVSSLPLGVWALLVFFLGCSAGMLASLFPRVRKHR